MRVVSTILFALAASAAVEAQSADIRVVSTAGLQGVVDRFGPEFERTSGHRLILRYGTSAGLKRELDDGLAFDVTILTPPMIDGLIAQNKVAGTAVVIARTGVGVAVSIGAAKPDIASVDKLRDALRKAAVVSYTKEGLSGAATARVIATLGVADEIKSRVQIDPRPMGGLLNLAEGRATLAFALMSEIASSPHVALVAPLPTELQTWAVFAGGVATDASDASAARDLLAFLRSKSVREALPNLGMEGE